MIHSSEAQFLIRELRDIKFNYDCDTFRSLGNEFFKENFYEDALKVYSFALNFKFDPLVLSNRSQVYLKLEKYRNAYIDANEALKLDGKNIKAGYRKAMALAGLGFYTGCRIIMETLQFMQIDAREVLGEFLKLPGSDMLKSALESMQNKRNTAKTTLQELNNYNPLESDDPNYGRDYFIGSINRFILINSVHPHQFEILPQWCFNSKEFERLKFTFSRWKTIPEICESFSEEARQLFSAGCHRSAIIYYCLMLCYPSVPNTLLNRAESHWAIRKTDKEASFYATYIDACEAYKAYEKCPKDPIQQALSRLAMAQALYFKAGSLYEMGFYSKALDTIDESLELNPDDADSKNIYTIIVMCQEEDKPIVENSFLNNYDPFNYYCEQSPDDDSNSLKVVDARRTKEDYHFWREHLKNFRFRAGEILWKKWLTKAQEYSKAGKHDEALAILTTIILKQKEESPVILNPRFYVERAEVYLRAKENYKAYVDTVEALKLDPKYAKALHIQSRALIALGYMSKASERFEEWLNTNPANRKIKNPQTGETMEQAYKKMIKMEDDPEIPENMLNKPTTSKFCDIVKEEDVLAYLRPVPEKGTFEYGVRKYQQENFVEALECFSERMAKKKTTELYISRARCYLRLEKPELAHEDVNEAFKFLKKPRQQNVANKNYLKSTLRLSTISLLRMKRYTEARNLHKDLVLADPEYKLNETKPLIFRSDNVRYNAPYSFMLGRDKTPIIPPHVPTGEEYLPPAERNYLTHAEMVKTAEMVAKLTTNNR